MHPNTLDTAGMADDPLPRPPRFDVWVCRGRMCTANGSNAVADASEAAVLAAQIEGVVAVLRGGCYGLCDLGPNVVVRRFVDDSEDVAADRLSLTGAANEFVYCGVYVDDVGDVLAAHVVGDGPLVRLTRAVREVEIVPTSRIEKRMRALRDRRSSTDHD